VSYTILAVIVFHGSVNECSDLLVSGSKCTVY
jgi:hypothetical protein